MPDHHHASHDHAGHDHCGHDHAEHDHSHAPSSFEAAFAAAIALNALIVVAEFVAGILGGSVALLSDAAHEHGIGHATLQVETSSTTACALAPEEVV